MATGSGRYQDGVDAAQLASLAERTKASENALALDGPFDRRIKRLELWRSSIIGSLAVIMFFAGVITSAFWGTIKHALGIP